MKFAVLLAATAMTLALPASAQEADPIAAVEAESERTSRVAREIWELAELGYLETQSSGLLVDEIVPGQPVVYSR